MMYSVRHIRIFDCRMAPMASFDKKTDSKHLNSAVSSIFMESGLKVKGQRKHRSWRSEYQRVLCFCYN